MHEITKAQADYFCKKFFPNSYEGELLCKNFVGVYKDYDDMLQKFIKYYGVKNGLPKNVYEIVTGDQRNNYITYFQFNNLFMTINYFLGKSKLEEIKNRKKWVESHIAPQSLNLFTKVTDFLNYMEPRTWLDYYVYTATYYEYRINTALPINTLEVGDWVFDQYGNELIVAEKIDKENIRFRETGVRLTNKLFVEYQIVSPTGSYDDVYLNKPNYDKPIYVGNMFVIPAQTTTLTSKLLDIKVDQIKMVVDRFIIEGNYKEII